MRAAAWPFTSAKPGERGLVDGDAGCGVDPGQNALLAVAKPALAHGQVALFQPDAGPVEIGHADIAEHQPGDFGAAAAQDQRALALAGDVIEHGLPRCGGDIGDIARPLHRAVVVAAGGDLDCPHSVPDRIDRILQAGKALSGFHDDIRCALLGGGDAHRQDQRAQRGDGQWQDGSVLHGGSMAGAG